MWKWIWEGGERERETHAKRERERETEMGEVSQMICQSDSTQYSPKGEVRNFNNTKSVGKKSNFDFTFLFKASLARSQN